MMGSFSYLDSLHTDPPHNRKTDFSTRRLRQGRRARPSPCADGEPPSQLSFISVSTFRAIPSISVWPRVNRQSRQPFSAVSPYCEWLETARSRRESSFLSILSVIMISSISFLRSHAAPHDKLVSCQPICLQALLPGISPGDRPLFGVLVFLALLPRRPYPLQSVIDFQGSCACLQNQFTEKRPFSRISKRRKNARNPHISTLIIVL